MVYLAVKGLTLMSAAVPLAHRDFCYREPSSKYSEILFYRLRIIQRL
jgi:hypothetical protein